MSSRAAEYRETITNVVAGGLLEDDERLVLRDMLARVERKILANMPDVAAMNREAAE